MRIQQSSNQNIRGKTIISVLPDVRKHLIPSPKNISKADQSAWVRKNPGGNSGNLVNLVNQGQVSIQENPIFHRM